MFEINGILNINKEKGYTSHDVVSIVKKFLKNPKVGHTGTLDPNATGVLPVCIGKATKISDFITNQTKEYIVELVLGVTSDTLDIWGNLNFENKNNIFFEKDQIFETIISFKGSYDQIPPMFSALKYKGQKLYDLARKGIEITRNSRKVNIFDIKILSIEDNIVKFVVTCSKGTYIRSLCDDIGKKLGCGAVMGNLIRSRTSIFSLENSINLEQFKNIVQNDDIKSKILKIEDVLFFMKKLHIDENYQKILRNGNKLSFDCVLEKQIKFENSEKVLVYDYLDNLIGIYLIEEENYCLRPIKILM